MGKIILIILGVLVVLFIADYVFFKIYLNLNTKELSPNEKILNGNADKKALVLYQKSKHDTATNITMALAEELNENGYTVVINHPSSELNYNVEDYDLLVFGSAVYMGTVSEPLQKYIDNAPLEGKDVVVYSVGGSLDEKQELELLKDKASRAKSVKGIKVSKGQEDVMKSFIKKCINK